MSAYSEKNADIFERLKELSKPLQELLISEYGPHCEIVISMDGVRIIQSILSVPTLKQRSKVVTSDGKTASGEIAETRLST